MNGSLYSHDLTNGYYTDIVPVYRNNDSSKFTPHSTNIYLRHSYAPSTHEHLHLKQEKQSSSINQRHAYRISLQQQQQSNLDKYNFKNRKSPSSIAYYDRIHEQVRSNTPVHSNRNSSLLVKQSREKSSIGIHGQPQRKRVTVLTNNPSQISAQSQVNKIG